MKNTWLIIGLLAAWIFTGVRPAWGQFWRGPGYYDDGGWASAVALASTNAAYSKRMQTVAQDRLAAQRYNTQQSMAMQRNIRNVAQQQDQQDWWFQMQQRQMAAQRPRVSSAGVPLAGGFGLGSPAAGGLTREDVHPPAAMDVIKWPPVLQGSEFASRRAEIEAPYRRSPPGLSVPTAADYRNMVKTVEEMKAILEWRLTQNGGLPTRDYEQSKAFLNNLGREAEERAEQSGGLPRDGKRPPGTSILPEHMNGLTV